MNASRKLSGVFADEPQARAEPAAEPLRAGPGADAHALQKMLSREFPAPVDELEPVVAIPAKPPAPPKSSTSRLLKALAGLAIIATVGWMPMERLFQVSSVEAVLNAPVITLRAPIDGVVGGSFADLGVGSPIATAEPLASIENARADDRALRQAASALAAARAERSATASRLGDLEANRVAVAARLEDYRAARTEKVAAQIREADAQVASAIIRLDRAKAALLRSSKLMAKGISAVAAAEDAKGEVDQADAAVKEAEAHRATLQVEADALAAGRFLGDDYNDEPRSAQRIEEIDQAISALKADAGLQEARIADAEADQAREQRDFDRQHAAAVVAPVGGRIWEVLTAPGERVAAGQPLASVLDCSKLSVTAAVSESVYNSLSVGQRAEFFFREGGAPLAGRVAQLSGVSSAASNFAILPSALTREAYRAVVTFDGAAPEGCPVGRTGRVVFGER